MGPDTTNVFLHHVRVFVTNPVTVMLGPELFVIGLAILFRWYGEQESLGGREFWRLSGKLVAGGLGLIFSGLLLFGARAEIVVHSGTQEARAFVQDFQAIGWLVGMGFVFLYFFVMLAARMVKGKKALLLDPVLPDFLAVMLMLLASYVLAAVAKHV